MTIANQIFWYQSSDAPMRRPCLFLDRDGVVVVEVDYLHRVADVRVQTGIAETLCCARAAGFVVGLVSNQSGIGRGWFGWEAFVAVQAEIVRQLALGPQPFDFVAACGTHPEATDPAYRVAAHGWRKPAPGMLRMAAEALAVDLTESIMVGDQLGDISAGLAAGIGRLVHLMTGHGARSRAAVAELAAELPPGRLLLLDGPADLPAALGWTALLR